MVCRLVGAGHIVRVLGRSDEKRSAIAELGADAVGDIAAVCADAELVVLCVFTDEQVRQVCLTDGLAGAMADTGTLVLHTTGSPRTAEAIAARGVDVVDAPVSGGPHDAAAGALTLFVGGSDDAVAKARPALSCYGDPILHVGPLGAGQKVKLINNTLFAAQIGLLANAVDLASRLGVTESALLTALPHGSAASRVVDIVAAGGSVASFIETAGEFVGKDVAVVRQIAAELGSDLGGLDDIVTAVIPGVG
ncbi:NAD(P)-dependent oxidoreductase [Candidatus Mycobacterium wuenschmannii]|uniref:NAD(P)-dependent oxidoreductase n=1 Tax=Candidatus Mycobacterium wuenschmannii TaxID=3027808 RepID=A0ABY8W346_9MYCO|nr:NAD(P)-dependent oxidoreductase [Candidatus Mycobacterium wuenschmannii]WIM90345.1 NAD(P)-dependent oxidoreductase [Candidatus Mycobacterium wuenschmannii]